MNLYEFEGKKIISDYGVAIPKSVLMRRLDDFHAAYAELDRIQVVVKAQVLSGKRSRNGGIVFCTSESEARSACEKLLHSRLNNQFVYAILLEEKLEIDKEYYLSLTYDTDLKSPVLIYSDQGGVDIEEVLENKIKKIPLDVRDRSIEDKIEKFGLSIPCCQRLWRCFLEEDCRLLEINPLARIKSEQWVAVDANLALDQDAFYRHRHRKFSPRAMLGREPTEREKMAALIDRGEKYYQGTAGKYIDMDGDVAVLFSGGGAGISNMDALTRVGLKPANYTEYSGNPSQEKVYKLTKIVLSKPGLRGLWIAGGVANFTDIEVTFSGIAQAFDELKPKYPIVIRRSGPNYEKGVELMRRCVKRNRLNLQIFDKDKSMSETAAILAKMVKK